MVMKKECKIVLLEIEDRLREDLYTQGHTVFGTELVLIFPKLRFPLVVLEIYQV